jgi:hypothetical protein
MEGEYSYVRFGTPCPPSTTPRRQSMVGSAKRFCLILVIRSAFIHLSTIYTTYGTLQVLQLVVHTIEIDRR